MYLKNAKKLPYGISLLNIWKDYGLLTEEDYNREVKKLFRKAMDSWQPKQ